MSELPRIPLYKVGEKVDIFPTWRLGTIKSLKWNREHQTFVYFLDGDDIHPKVPYPEDCLLLTPQETPVAHGQEDEYLVWRLYLIEQGDGLRQKIFVDGRIHTLEKIYSLAERDYCIQEGIARAISITRFVRRSHEEALS